MFLFQPIQVPDQPTNVGSFDLPVPEHTKNWSVDFLPKFSVCPKKKSIELGYVSFQFGICGAISKPTGAMNILDLSPECIDLGFKG